MNIVHIVEYIDMKYGGPSVCVPSIASAQCKAGHKVRVICYKPESETEFFDYIKTNIPDYALIEFVFMPRPDTLSKLTIFPSTKCLLSVSLTGMDVLHIHGLWRPLLLSAIRISQRKSIKTVITPHGMLDPWSLSQSKFKKKIALLLGWRKALNSCHYLHALNESEKSLITPLRLKCPVRIVSNGVFKEYFVNLPSKTIFYDKHPELQGKKFILFLSRLHFKKGLDYLLDSYRELSKMVPGIDLVIAGPDGGELDSVNQFIKNHKAEANIHYVGPLYNDEKFEALVAASCFCLPSRQEGFSIAITEALACGTPVVISENCNFPEVQENHAGFVVKLESKKISEALKNIIEDDVKAKKMSQLARELVFNNYIWDVVAEKLVEGYH